MTDSPLVATFERFAGDALRDVWVFDERSHDCLYLRADVAERVDRIDPERYIDNERYGFVTRATYEDLTYASYGYTVRGFDEFVQFRTFLSDRVGVLASVDAGEPRDFATLNADLGAFTDAAYGDLSDDVTTVSADD